MVNARKPKKFLVPSNLDGTRNFFLTRLQLRLDPISWGCQATPLR